MADRRLEHAVDRVRTLVAAQEAGGRADGELLRRFVAHREETAFAALVQRHGGMVLGVCRRVLRDAHDAEDACQATFLVLARKAASIRKHRSVASWLHGVAYRVAMRLRATVGHRRGREVPLSDLPQPDDADVVIGRELRQVLDEELRRLPERLRAPLVLCYLEGRTRAEVAAELGWTLGTVRGRLEQGRRRLQMRLTRRGVVLALGLTVGTMPAGLASATAQAAVRFAADPGLLAGVVSGPVVTLTEGVLTMLGWRKTTVVVAVMLLAVALAGGGMATYHVFADGQPPANRDAEDGRPPPVDREALRYGGKTFDEWRTILRTELKPEVRIEAIKALAAFGANGYGKEAAQAIVEAVCGYDIGRGSEDDQKVEEAGKAGLRKIGDEAVAVLVQELKTGNVRGRRLAVATLAMVGPDAASAVPALIDALRDKDFPTRIGAVEALGAVDTDGASTAAVVALLTSPHAGLRQAVIRFLAGSQPRVLTAAPQLLTFARQGTTQERVWALELLVGNKANQRYVLPAVVSGLTDEKEEIRNRARENFHLASKELKKAAVPLLVEALKTARDAKIRHNLVGLLGDLGPLAREALPLLEEIQKSTFGDETSKPLFEAAHRAIQAIKR